jgi:hypothetical protein
VSIKGKPRDLTSDNSPGPGAYDPTLEAVKHAVRGIDLRSSLKPINDDYSKTTRNWIPGPGTYFNPNSYFGKEAPAFSLRGKSNEKLSISVPGPGSYDVKDPRSKSPGFRMSKGQRINDTSASKNSVGPGMYDQSHKRVGTEGPKFSMGVKTESKNRNDSPGPGAYEPSIEAVKNKSPQISVKGRTELMSAKSYAPGPGAYDQHSLIGKDSPLISIKGRPQ